MHRSDRRTVQAGDSVVCRSCGDETVLSQRQLDELHETGSNTNPFITALPNRYISVEALKALQCKACHATGAIKIAAGERKLAHGGETPGTLRSKPLPTEATSTGFWSQSPGRCTVCGSPSILGDSVCYAHNN